MPIDVRKIIDTLVPTTQESERVKEQKRPLDPPREETLGYAFAIGDRVIDKVTGQPAKILGAERGSHVVRKKPAESSE